MLGREQTGCESKGAVPEPPAASLWTYEKQALKSNKVQSGGKGHTVQRRQVALQWLVGRRMHKTDQHFSYHTGTATYHPNQPFVHSVCQGLREGFWPWANTHRTGCPITHHEPAKGVPDATRLKFFRRQLRHEQMKGRYSQAVGPTLLPGMYS